MQETWRPIPGYETDYSVSTHGRIRSQRRGRIKILKPIFEKWNGYFIVTLYDKNGKSRKERISRLVALAFIPNPHALPEVNHKDEDKTNNNVDNLEWCTHAYNSTYGTSRQRAVQTRYGKASCQ